MVLELVLWFLQFGEEHLVGLEEPRVHDFLLLPDRLLRQEEGQCLQKAGGAGLFSGA